MAVAAARNITRAAEQLHISQPPLSRQIRDLEDELGVLLFDRGNKQIQLTAVGKIFLKDARDVLQRVNEATLRVRALSGQGAGELRIGYAPAPTVELLPRAMKLFRKVAPKIQVALQDLSTDEMLQSLTAREIDLAVLVKPPLKKGGRLVFELLQEMSVGLVVAVDHPFARRRSVTLEESLSQPFVAFIRKGYSDYHHWLDIVVKKARIKPRLAAQVDSSSSMIAAVQSGQGVALAPPTFVTIAATRVKYIPVIPPAPAINLGFVVRTGPATPAVQAFMNSLRLAAK
ncbi:MAG: LysR family transcriptional regulator [Verrucomicrobia bacterium]|nr:LysR family transcriptional regulator [Verrucomicrobiota bacterium]